MKMSNGDFMANKAVSDTGPIIHLKELDLISCLKIFDKIMIPEEVNNELRKRGIAKLKSISIVPLKKDFMNLVKKLVNADGLGFGESQAIALTIQERADYFLTDDLDARNTAREQNLEVHGTIGIILRAFRDKIINKKEAIEKLRNIKELSTLFITSDIIQKIISEIDSFKGR